MTDNPFMIRLKSLIDDITDGNKKRFAETLGIGATHINDWTNRGSVPNAFYLAIIHKKTGVNLHWLIAGEGYKFLKQDLAGAGISRETTAPYGQNFIEVRSELERQCAQKLLRILRSDDDLIKGAIIPNLNAFDDRLIERSNAKKNTANEK